MDHEHRVLRLSATATRCVVKHLCVGVFGLALSMRKTFFEDQVYY